MKAKKIFCRLDFINEEPTFVFKWGGCDRERYLKTEFADILKKWDWYYRGAPFVLIKIGSVIKIKRGTLRVSRKKKKDWRKLIARIQKETGAWKDPTRHQYRCLNIIRHKRKRQTYSSED